MMRFNPDLASELRQTLVLGPASLQQLRASRLRGRVRDEWVEGDGVHVELALMLLSDWVAEAAPSPDPAALLVELMRRNLPEGWGAPGDLIADQVRRMIVARWVAVSGVDREAGIEAARRLLAADLPGWVPEDSEDPRLLALIAR